MNGQAAAVIHAGSGGPDLQGLEGWDREGEPMDFGLDGTWPMNAFAEPNRVSSVALEGFPACGGFDAVLPPHSFTAYRLSPRH
jgi:hypothetical protein